MLKGLQGFLLTTQSIHADCSGLEHALGCLPYWFLAGFRKG